MLAPLSDSYNDLVTRVISEVRKAGLGDTADEASHLPWTPSQFWYIVKALASNPTVSFDEVRNSPPFGKVDTALFALEDAEIIALEYEKGRPYTIRVGRPIARVAFKAMVEDDVKFAAFMGVKECDAEIAGLVTKYIEPAEAELQKLQTIMGGAGGSAGLHHYMTWENRRAMENRVKQLSGAIAENTAKIEKISAKRGEWAKKM
jgi:hypothetical protein